MPNNNPTLLTITGDADALKQFMNDVNGDESGLDFETIYPIPEKEDWYSWCCRYWVPSGARTMSKSGKKYPTPCGLCFKKTTVHLHRRSGYCTAWAPATAFYLHISQQYPTIVFKQEFADEGGRYVGFNSIQNGHTINEYLLNWNEDDGKALRMTLREYHDDDDDDESDEDV